VLSCATLRLLVIEVGLPNQRVAKRLRLRLYDARGAILAQTGLSQARFLAVRITFGPFSKSVS
jgi:hypothetical protein